ncbi:hypothetical protein EDB85DRAFT_2271900 [Lactarius pseudohatsudake]|nr:hypothetical protein EDB85DRAFT_2271900 [Lactarius pseudohatsudake]
MYGARTTDNRTPAECMAREPTTNNNDAAHRRELRISAALTERLPTRLARDHIRSQTNALGGHNRHEATIRQHGTDQRQDPTHTTRGYQRSHGTAEPTTRPVRHTNGAQTSISTNHNRYAVLDPDVTCNDVPGITTTNGWTVVTHRRPRHTDSRRHIRDKDASPDPLSTGLWLLQMLARVREARSNAETLQTEEVRPLATTVATSADPISIEGEHDTAQGRPRATEVEVPGDELMRRGADTPPVRRIMATRGDTLDDGSTVNHDGPDGHASNPPVRSSRFLEMRRRVREVTSTIVETLQTEEVRPSTPAATIATDAGHIPSGLDYDSTEDEQTSRRERPLHTTDPMRRAERYCQTFEPLTIPDDQGEDDPVAAIDALTDEAREELREILSEDDAPLTKAALWEILLQIKSGRRHDRLEALEEETNPAVTPGNTLDDEELWDAFTRHDREEMLGQLLGDDDADDDDHLPRGGDTRYGFAYRTRNLEDPYKPDIEDGGSTRYSEFAHKPEEWGDDDDDETSNVSGGGRNDAQPLGNDKYFHEEEHEDGYRERTLRDGEGEDPDSAGDTLPDSYIGLTDWTCTPDDSDAAHGSATPQDEAPAVTPSRHHTISNTASVTEPATTTILTTRTARTRPRRDVTNTHTTTSKKKLAEVPPRGDTVAEERDTPRGMSKDEQRRRANMIACLHDDHEKLAKLPTVAQHT